MTLPMFKGGNNTWDDHAKSFNESWDKNSSVAPLIVPQKSSLNYVTVGIKSIYLVIKSIGHGIDHLYDIF